MQRFLANTSVLPNNVTGRLSGLEATGTIGLRPPGRLCPMRPTISTFALLLLMTSGCSGPALECLPGECESTHSESEGGPEPGSETGAVDPSGDGDSGTVDPGDGDSGDGDGDPSYSCEDAGRREFAEIVCDEAGCSGRWQGSDWWSVVLSAEVVLAGQEIEPDTLWSCQADPPVDVCVSVNATGGCFWILDGWAVPVAPCCAVEGWGWLPVGDGMAAAGSNH
jgi:hypothetical protein